MFIFPSLHLKLKGKDISHYCTNLILPEPHHLKIVVFIYEQMYYFKFIAKIYRKINSFDFVIKII